MANTHSPRAHPPLRLRLSVQARLHFAQLLLWQILAFMALLAVFLLHDCGILAFHSQAVNLRELATWQHIWYQATGLDVFWHAALSLALLYLGRHISMNAHRAILPTHLVIEDNKLFWQTGGTGSRMDTVPLQALDSILLQGRDLDDLLQAASSDISVHLKRRYHPTIIIRKDDFEQADALLQLLPRLMVTTHPKTKFQFFRQHM